MKGYKKKILKILGLHHLSDFIKKIRFFHFRYHFPFIETIYKSSSVTKINVPPINDSLLSRLIESTSKDIDHTTTGMWGSIFSAYQAEVVKPIYEKDNKKILELLENPLSNNLQYGFDNLAKELQSPLRLETLFNAKSTADHFVALAEYTETIKYVHPEALISLRKNKVFLEDLINKITEDKFQNNFFFPNPYIGEKGVSTKYGIASQRVPAAIYQALRVRKFGTRICEIGPGLGRTAFFANLIGVKKYTLVDLPIPSLCQGYFLGCSLPNESFCFNGEDNSFDKGLKLIQPQNFINDVDKYDVVLNVDSLTEMNIDVARDYLKSLINKTKWFLSINHEANEFSVKQMADDFPEYELTAKNRSWIRKGYVEELYRISKLDEK